MWPSPVLRAAITYCELGYANGGDRCVKYLQKFWMFDRRSI
ncbi:hypothetical protein [Chamaesiphon polymorphus]|nr:hypothetical protein [Chamaesiphon polymorphus]